MEPQQQRDVRQRPDRGDRDRLRDARAGAAPSGRPRPRADRGGRRLEGVVPMPLSPWTSVARTTSPTSGPAAPSATGMSPRAVGVQEAQGVLGAVPDVGVAADGRDRQQVEFGAGDGQADGQRVVEARVAVDDERQRMVDRAERRRPRRRRRRGRTSGRHGPRRRVLPAGAHDRSALLVRLAGGRGAADAARRRPRRR